MPRRLCPPPERPPHRLLNGVFGLLVTLPPPRPAPVEEPACPRPSVPVPALAQGSDPRASPQGPQREGRAEHGAPSTQEGGTGGDGGGTPLSGPGGRARLYRCHTRSGRAGARSPGARGAAGRPAAGECCSPTASRQGRCGAGRGGLADWLPARVYKGGTGGARISSAAIFCPAQVSAVSAARLSNLAALAPPWRTRPR